MSVENKSTASAIALLPRQEKYYIDQIGGYYEEFAAEIDAMQQFVPLPPEKASYLISRAKILLDLLEAYKKTAEFFQEYGLTKLAAVISAYEKDVSGSIPQFEAAAMNVARARGGSYQGTTPPKLSTTAAADDPIARRAQVLEGLAIMRELTQKGIPYPIARLAVDDKLL